MKLIPKMVLTAAVVASVLTGIAAEPVSATRPVWGELFSSAQQKKWSLQKGGAWRNEDGTAVLKIELAPGEGRKGVAATVPVDIRSVRGMQLYGEVQFRARDVSKPEKPWQGIKFALSFQSGGKAEYVHPVNLWGTNDWKTVNFSCIVPADAEKGQLYLGLENSTGTVEFRSLAISAFMADPSGRKAEYDPEFLARPRRRGVMSPGSSGSRPTIYRPQDLEDLAGWGANLIRWQLLVGGMKAKPEDPGYLQEFDERMNILLNDLDRVLEQAARLNIQVVIDLHTAVGGLMPESEKVGYYRDKAVHYRKEYADYFVALWKRIALRYRGNSVIWAYNLMNEPWQNKPAPYDYYRLQLAAAKAIREIDPDTPISVEPTQMSNPVAFSYLPLFPLKNIIYQVHMYEPMEFTHQFVHIPAFVKEVAYPGNTARYGRVDRETLKKLLQPVRDFQLKYGARIYVGEFSAVRWAPGADRYLEDLISIFEEYQWDWTYHAFREWSGWSVEHSGRRDDDCPAAADTNRKKVLLKYFSRNRN